MSRTRVRASTRRDGTVVRAHERRVDPNLAAAEAAADRSAAAAAAAMSAPEPESLFALAGSLARKGKTPTEHQKHMQGALEEVMSGQAWEHSLTILGRLSARRGLSGPWNRMAAVRHCARIGGDGTVLPASEWEKLGREIKPGCKGFKVWIPSVQSRTEETGEKDENGDPELKTVKSTFVNYGGHNGKGRYYDVTETDGPETADSQHVERAKSVTGSSHEADMEFLSAMNSAAERAGCEIEIRPASEMRSSEMGHLEPATGKIVIRDDMEPAAQAAVIAHELAHHFDPYLVGAENPTERSSRYRSRRAECEFVAESVAYAVCAQWDVDTADSSAEYLHAWRPERARQAKNLWERSVKAMDAILVGAGGEEHARWSQAA